MQAAEIARVTHEANRALQIVQNDPSVPVAPPWDECGNEMQMSAIDGVEAVIRGAGPEASHVNWLEFKAAHGWVYGPVKDEALKQHPCMVPYADLPESQRVKDDLFGEIVHILKDA